MPDLRLIVGSRDVTNLMETPTWSDVDPGGLESLTVKLNAPIEVRPGQRVRLCYGLQVLWWGDVNDPGDHSHGIYSTAQIVATGPGRVFKQSPIRRAFVHNKISDWQNLSSSTGANLASYPPSFNVSIDNGISIGWTANVVLKNVTYGGVYLDLGPDIKAKRVVTTYLWSNSTTNGNQIWGMNVGDGLPDSGMTESVFTANPGTGQVSGTRDDTLTVPRRYIMISAGSNAGGDFTPTGDLLLLLYSVQVFGETRYTAGNQSILTPSTVVRDVLKTSRSNKDGVVPGRIDDASAFVIQHLMYQSPTQPESIFLDMARLMGWHVGVWEPAGLEERPRLFFHPVPAIATATVDWSQVEDGDPPRARLDNLYSACNVTYQSANGVTSYVTVARPNPFLDNETRVLEVNMGIGTAASAAVYAKFALALAEASARGGGSCTLPPIVDTPSGPKPAVLLRAGRDRLRLRGLPDIPGLLETDTRRYDTFHLRRIEHTLDKNGAIKSRAEFDSGGDLLETLNARAEMVLGAAGVS